MNPEKYLKYLVPSSLFGTERTKEILNVNPTIEAQRVDADEATITVYNYNATALQKHDLTTVGEIFDYKRSAETKWINIDGLRKEDVEAISSHFAIHPLITEDILSIQQRPKMDEVEDVVYCLLNMLYFNNVNQTVEQEQISIVLGKDFVITFQEDPKRDVFDPIREKLTQQHSKLRQRGADYLCYSMLDLIVDNYFLVMENIGESIEEIEEEIIRSGGKKPLANINQLRKELIVLKRNIVPVRDLISGILRSENDLIKETTFKYYKDVYDHIIQAHDLSENYRDMMLSIQDLYVNNVNLRLNEVMKVMAIVTCLLAPATVIGGIFGMNFETIPLLHNKWGFLISVSIMLLIPVWMLTVFKRRGWF